MLDACTLVTLSHHYLLLYNRQPQQPQQPTPLASSQSQQPTTHWQQVTNDRQIIKIEGYKAQNMSFRVLGFGMFFIFILLMDY